MTPTGEEVCHAMVLSALVALLADSAQTSQQSMYPDLGDFKKGLKLNAQRCAAAHHVQYLQVLALMETPTQTGYDRNSKCFVCCMMERYETLTPDGEFLDGTMRRYVTELPESQLKVVAAKHLDTCLREGGSQRHRKSKEISAYYAVDLLLSKRKNGMTYVCVGHQLCYALRGTDYSRHPAPCRDRKHCAATDVEQRKSFLDNDDICEKCYQFAKCYYDRAKVKPDSNRKQAYKRQQPNNYQHGSSSRFLQSVGNWADTQWSHAGFSRSFVKS